MTPRILDLIQTWFGSDPQNFGSIQTWFGSDPQNFGSDPNLIWIGPPEFWIWSKHGLDRTPRIQRSIQIRFWIRSKILEDFGSIQTGKCAIQIFFWGSIQKFWGSIQILKMRYPKFGSDPNFGSIQTLDRSKIKKFDLLDWGILDCLVCKILKYM